MASTQQFILKASADAAESVRSNKRAIRQIDESCAASRRELESSYELLRKVRRSLGETPPTKSVEGGTEKPEQNRRTRGLRFTQMPLDPVDEGRSFDPKAVAILLKAYEGVVAELGLQASAEKEMAAKYVIRLARRQGDLDPLSLRNGAASSMLNECEAADLT
jgi:hypothetical protein